MALNKMIPHRLLTMSRTNCRTSLPRAAVKAAALSRTTSHNSIAPDPGDDSIFRRYLHRQSAATLPLIRFLPTGEKLLERIREIDISRGRNKLDGLRPSSASEESPKENLTAIDAKKILRLSQLETVKTKLRMMDKDLVSYPEFMEICVKESSNWELGREFAKILNDSGTVIVLGNIVFLKPEKVVKAIQGLVTPLPLKPDHPRMKELQELERQKAFIDTKAESLVRRELWLGLGYLVVQTAAFMRLTFWDLSWDVMEPICFYVTSMYFMGGYAFFLRTKIEPSFEGFFQSRFSAKQKRLMKALEFDVERYHELKKACDPLHAGESAVSFAPRTHLD